MSSSEGAREVMAEYFDDPQDADRFLAWLALKGYIIVRLETVPDDEPLH